MKRKILILFFLLFSLFAYSQADCPAEYVCANQNNETVTAGLTNELNNSNEGCLSSGEASASHWYRICALTAGSITFTISPSGSNNDYDFAMWNGSNCPPTTAPIRCSYALSQAGNGGDNTGVSTLANAPQTDNSEGAGGNQWTQNVTATAGQCFIICINNFGPGSNTFDLTFGGTASLNCVVLPIELVSFYGKQEGFHNRISWSTITEKNNAFFNIEKSMDGISFYELKRVQGSENSNAILHYSTYDDSPVIGENYYRLKQIDLTGEFSYSKIIVVSYNVSNSKPNRITNYLGQDVNDEYQGVKLYHYPNGVVRKVL